MSQSHGWGVPEQHLLPDAIVAFVDGELSEVAARRASTHLRRCQSCAAETAAQRQARGAVRSAAAPQVPLGLLSSLRAIPSDVELPDGPDGLMVSSDGTLVALQRQREPSRSGDNVRLGTGAVLGTTTPLGTGAAMLGGTEHPGAGRRAVQGAGVVVSGLVLGALVLVVPHVDGQQAPARSPSGSVAPAVAPAGAQVVRAQLGGDAAATSTTPAPTSVSVSLAH